MYKHNVTVKFMICQSNLVTVSTDYRQSENKSGNSYFEKVCRSASSYDEFRSQILLTESRFEFFKICQ